MPKKIYVVELTAEERCYLQSFIAKGRAAARKILHARILLKSDSGPDGPAWTDQKIVEALDVSRPSVERLRKRFVEEGLEAALNRKEQKNRKPRKLDGKAEAHLIAVACSAPPEGRARWTLKLLADRLVELEVVQSISYETVRRTLKKTT
jgi:transposase